MRDGVGQDAASHHNSFVRDATDRVKSTAVVCAYDAVGSMTTSMNLRCTSSRELNAIQNTLSERDPAADRQLRR